MGHESNAIANQLLKLGYHQEKKKSPFFLDPLLCFDEQWEEEEEEACSTEAEELTCCSYGVKSRVLLEQDLFWDEQELSTLLAKEDQNRIETDPSAMEHRRDSVDWTLRAVAHYSFSAQTAVLAVNYLDRFLSSVCLQREKPWMVQLAAVACLSLAAKVEETQVPLLLDLQVEETRFVFEAKTIQRTEILVLSTLQWKMNPVTPLSFLHYITRRLGLKDHLCWEFLRRCDLVLLSLISDTRFLCYLPSVIATATMLHVVKCVEPCLQAEYHTQLLGILGVDHKDKVEKCCRLISELSQPRKRKLGSMPGSPNGVMDASFSSDSSNESWAVSKKSKATQDEDQLLLETHSPP